MILQCKLCQGTFNTSVYTATDKEESLRRIRIGLRVCEKCQDDVVKCTDNRCPACGDLLYHLTGANHICNYCDKTVADCYTCLDRRGCTIDLCGVCKDKVIEKTDKRCPNCNHVVYKVYLDKVYNSFRLFYCDLCEKQIKDEFHFNCFDGVKCYSTLCKGCVRHV